MDWSVVVEVVIAGILAPMLAEVRGMRADAARYQAELKEKFAALDKDLAITAERVNRTVEIMSRIEVVTAYDDGAQ